MKVNLKTGSERPSLHNAQTTYFQNKQMFFIFEGLSKDIN